MPGGADPSRIDPTKNGRPSELDLFELDKIELTVGASAICAEPDVFATL
jgi:hypothetical protein